MFAEPEKILRQFGLHENMIVADLGAGSGFYTLPAGKMISGGKVYAVEVQKDFLITIKNKIKETHLTNVETIWGDIEKIGGTKLRDGIVDAVIASNVLFQVEEKENFIKEIRRILKKGGRVLLIDWSDSSSALGPNALHLVSENKAKDLFEKFGFVVDGKVDAGAHHYGMILRLGSR